MHRAAALFAAVSVVAACTHETISPELGVCRLSPSVSVDASVKAPDGSVVDGSALGFAPRASELSFKVAALSGDFEGEWASVDDYPVDQSLHPGSYRVSAYYGDIEEEGFGKPCFGAWEDINLVAGKNTDVSLTATLLNSAVAVSYTDAFRQAFPHARATFHSEGGGYLPYTADDGSYMFLRPGNVNVILDGLTLDGHEFSYAFHRIEGLSAASVCGLTLDAANVSGTEVVKAAFLYDGSENFKELAVTHELASTPSPELECSGFESGMAISNVEGTYTGRTLTLSVKDAAELSMTTEAVFISGSIGSAWPAEVNLMSLDSETASLLEEGGIAVRKGADETVVDLTGVASRLSVARPHALFTFLATGPTGLVSEPVVLGIDVEPAKIEIVSQSDVVIGVNTANFLIESDSDNLGDNLRMYASDDGTEWYECEIESITPSDTPGRYDVTVSIPTQSSNEVKVRVDYCNRTVSETVMQVVSPKYTIDVDAFALSAKVRINADTEDMRRLITAIARVYADGRRCHVIDRDIDNSIITVGDLKADTKYSFTSTVADDYTDSDLTPAVTVTTEKTAGLANSDFEDIKYHALKYKNMPSGGRYSQTIVEIYNCQNYTDFDYSIPEKWATTNAKTFCMKAKNINTWYVEPSVYTVDECAGGNFAVKLQSTAWDTDGQSIPDWRQPSQPYVGYSRAIPEIAHRAAARLFLGSYSFDASTLDERFDTGVDFSSRPSAVNGYFKYVPSISDPSDRGKVEVNVLGTVEGKQQVIASGTQLLGASLDYTTFTVPLTYTLFGVKATGISVMISSSEDTGSIDYESLHISTWDDVEKSRSLGSALWVDEITLSY